MGMQGVDSEKAYQNWTLEVENEISTPLFKKIHDFVIFTVFQMCAKSKVMCVRNAKGLSGWKFYQFNISLQF